MRNKHKKIIAIMVLMILTFYVYGLTRTIKDVLLVPSLGAEILSTLKLYGTLPVSIAIMLTYTKLLRVWNRTLIYHSINAFFICFFAIFTFYLYPNASSLHIDPDSIWIHDLKRDWPFFQYLVVMISNWTYSIFYILCELWGSVMMVLLFWQTVNQITDLKYAKTDYPFFILIGQLGLIASGETIQYCSKMGMGWDNTLNSIVLIVIPVSILMSGTFFYLTHYVVGVNEINNMESEPSHTRKSLIENLRSVISSRYTFLIILLIICYAFCATLVETLWKSIIAVSFTDPLEYGRFMGQIQSYTAITSIILMVFSTYIMRFVSWRFSSMITPFIILITSVAFFISVIYYHYIKSEDLPTNGFEIISLAILLGAVQNILSRSCHAFFDPAKEMAFIPIKEPSRSIAKAFDMVAVRIGKACAALIQWLMLSFILNSSLVSIAPNLMVILLLVLITWILGIMSLSHEFNNKLG